LERKEMNEVPRIIEETEKETDNVIPFERPILKLAPTEPNGGDWLSGFEPGTEFKCRDKTGRNPRWLINDFTYLGMLKGDVYLSPTVTLSEAKTWFWVDPKAFCKEWEFRGIIEEPKVEDKGVE
jgi:hypothetical protein